MTRPKPKKPPKVAGEQAELLVEALRRIEYETEPDGMVHFGWTCRPGSATPSLGRPCASKPSCCWPTLASTARIATRIGLRTPGVSMLSFSWPGV